MLRTSFNQGPNGRLLTLRLSLQGLYLCKLLRSWASWDVLRDSSTCCACGAQASFRIILGHFKTFDRLFDFGAERGRAGSPQSSWTVAVLVFFSI